MEFEVDRMEPLFATEADYKEFTERHAKHQVPVKDLATYQGKAIPWYRCRFYNNQGCPGR